MRGPIGKLLGGRDLLLLTDTALLSGSSVLLLVIAARALPSSGLTAFALAQPLIATAVGTQRATFLSPALVVQRTIGRSAVPLTWIARLSLPIAAIVAVIGWLTLGLRSGAPYLVVAVVLVAAAAALAQDVVRYRLLSSGLIRGALMSDATLTVVTAGMAVLIPFVHDWRWLLGVWSGAMAVAVLVGVGQLRRGHERLADVRLRDTWRLGRWSGLDSLLGTVSYLLPLYISSLVLGTAFAGVYRLLQAANGPLNILDTTIVTSFGLDAWRIRDESDVARLKARSRRLIVLMAAVAAGYLAIAEVLIVVLSGLQSPDLVRIALIVLIAGMLGAVTTPLSAGSLALGYQRSGAIIRAVVVAGSIMISLGAGLHLPLPWNDPIGTVALLAPSATLVGWACSFRFATRRAIAEAPQQAQPVQA